MDGMKSKLYTLRQRYPWPADKPNVSCHSGSVLISGEVSGLIARIV